MYESMWTMKLWYVKSRGDFSNVRKYVDKEPLVIFKVESSKVRKYVIDEALICQIQRETAGYYSFNKV